MSNSDPLRRPDDWQDPVEEMREKHDFSKVPRYIDDNGLEFWGDILSDTIMTNEEGTFLSFHQCYGRDYHGHSFAKLHFAGSFVTLTQDGKSLPVQFGLNYREKTDEGAYIWHVDHIFRKFLIADNETYPWVLQKANLPLVEVEGISSFKSVQQQERFIYLVRILLSKHSSNSIKAKVGEKAQSVVVFGGELLKAFETGELIK